MSEYIELVIDDGVANIHHQIDTDEIRCFKLANGETLIVAKWPLYVADLDRIKKYVEKDK